MPELSVGGDGGVRASAEERDREHVLGPGAALAACWAARSGLAGLD